MLAVATFANTLPNGFALDDLPLVRDNPQLDPASSSGPLQLFWQPYWPNMPSAGLYRPLTTLSWFLDRRLWGPSPMGFHGTNVLLHAWVTALVWFAARGASRFYGTALIAAALFAVHPLHVEAVANIAGRSELLAAGFTLLAWVCHRRRWFVIAVAAYACALLSKEHTLLAPVLFWLDDRLRREPARRAYFGFAIAAALVLAARTYVLGGWGGPDTTAFLDNPAASAGVWPRIATATWVQLKYAILFVWPATLSSDYSLDAIPVCRSLVDLRVWAGLGFAAGVVALGAYGWRHSHPVALGVACIVLFALPTSNVLFATGTAMAERLAYLPSLGGCLLAGHGLAWLADRDHSPLRQFASPLRAAVPIVVAIVVCSAFFGRALARNPVWKSNATLALHDVQVMPRSAKLHAGAGIVLSQRGDPLEAEAAFRRALAIYPDYAQVRFNLGQLLAARGAAPEAIEHLTRAGQISPHNPRPFKSLAPLLEQAGDRVAALEAYRRAAELDPFDFGVRFNYGRASLAANRPLEETLQILDSLSRDAPGSIPGQLAAALALATRGQTDAARQAYRAILDTPGLPPSLRQRILTTLAGLDSPEIANP